MTNKKTTKRALIASVVSLMLCFTMLLGTTYAWFTDSVTSTNNIIKSGNLDIVLEYFDAKNEKWVEVDETTELFKEETLWEPGHTEVVYLKVTNAGSLALKYNLGVNVVSETEGTNVDGKNFKLSDYIMFGVKDGKEPSYADRNAACEAVKDNAKKISEGYTKNSYIKETNVSEYVALVVYMPETVGNEANHKTGTAAPVIKLGVNLVATQVESETDGFGNDYDAGLDPTISYVADTADLAKALQKGGTVRLIGDISVPADAMNTTAAAIPVAFAITGGEDIVIDLNGYNITMEATEEQNALIFVHNTNVTITGNGSVTQKGIDNSYLIWAKGASEVNIEGGDFASEDSEGIMLYASGNTAWDPTDDYATINIYGGNFTSNSTNPQYFANVMNHGVGRVNYYGGTFSWNPAVDVDVDDKAYVKVAEGYSSVDNNNGTWTVMPGENTVLVTDGVYYDNVDTYYVFNGNGLAWVANEVNATSSYKDSFATQTVKLIEDIDLGGAEWTPIGDYRFDANRFGGTFDGQGHTISNFKITKKTAKDDANKSSYGFFGNLRGTVKNLTIDNATVNVPVKFAAVLVGRMNSGTIDNCHVTNSSVTASDWTVGGLVAQLNDGTIKNSSVEGTTVTGYAAVGAIAGVALNSGERTIENCSVKDCSIVQNGHFGGHYDLMFGSVLGAAYSGELTVYLNGCEVENTTVLGAESNELYGYATESDIIYIDGICVKGKTVTYDSANGTLLDVLSTLKRGDTLVLPAGEYNVSGKITIPDGVTVKAETAETVIFNQQSSGDSIFICAGDAVIKNITFVVNRKGYAIADNTKDHDTYGDITIEGCVFKVNSSVTDKSWGVYKNRYGDITIKDCTFIGFENAVCGVKNEGDSNTVITGCTFTDCIEAIGYVTAQVPADFEETVIANNTGLTADNVIGH